MTFLGRAWGCNLFPICFVCLCVRVFRLREDQVVFHRRYGGERESYQGQGRAAGRGHTEHAQTLVLPVDPVSRQERCEASRELEVFPYQDIRSVQGVVQSHGDQLGAPRTAHRATGGRG